MGAFRNVLIVNTLVAVGIAVLHFFLVPISNRGDFWFYFIYSLIYSQVIGTTAALVLTKFGVRFWHRRGPVMWFLFVATLLAVSTFGTALAVVLLWLFRMVPSGAIITVFMTSLRVATIITLIVGIASFFFESLRLRGERTALELKQQQLLNERAQKLASEVRFSSLQSRLQPHFLFNTINSILTLIRDDPAGAEQMLQRLSRLLRYALDSQQRTTVSLGEELKLVTDYLEIEQTRFGQRLRFAIDAPSELHNWPVPPYALQTLIENSMKYVVGARREGGTIQLHARREAASLLLEVRDDGNGFDLADVPAGHGLDTLIQRLQMLYNDTATLTAQSLSPGCAVRLRLPGETT